MISSVGFIHYVLAMPHSGIFLSFIYMETNHISFKVGQRGLRKDFNEWFFYDKHKILRGDDVSGHIGKMVHVCM